jgi:hypothetical protein
MLTRGGGGGGGGMAAKYAISSSRQQAWRAGEAEHEGEQGHFWSFPCSATTPMPEEANEQISVAVVLLLR